MVIDRCFPAWTDLIQGKMRGKQDCTKKNTKKIRRFFHVRIICFGRALKRKNKIVCYARKGLLNMPVPVRDRLFCCLNIVQIQIIICLLGKAEAAAGKPQYAKIGCFLGSKGLK